MKREVTIEEISDGRLYGSNDMVKADCFGCEGCSDCCHGMGASIVLDPLDSLRLCGCFKCTFSQLLEQYVELNLVDGLILPNLRMSGPDEACTFLDENGRCRIHSHRPGICRMFPLGRFYENRGFRYFLQIHECPREKRGKVKVKKWLDTPNLREYEAFITDWHYFLVDVQAVLDEDGSEERRRIAVTYILKQFYEIPFGEETFYEEIKERLELARKLLGV